MGEIYETRTSSVKPVDDAPGPASGAEGVSPSCEAKAVVNLSLEELQRLAKKVADYLEVPTPKVVVDKGLAELGASAMSLYYPGCQEPKILISPKLLEKDRDWQTYVIVHETLHYYFRIRYPNTVFHHAGKKFRSLCVQLSVFFGVPSDKVAGWTFWMQAIGRREGASLRRRRR